MTAASPLPTAPVVEVTDAIAYRRAHTGKLMVISRAEGREPALSDFFHFDSVGTHPTGLFVTGIFDDDRRSHMRVSLVRNANEAEIAWRNSARK
ncbi:MAG: hypothetical protein ACXV8H_00945 [Chthoniobacterales bacterium]